MWRNCEKRFWEIEIRIRRKIFISAMNTSNKNDDEPSLNQSHHPLLLGHCVYISSNSSYLVRIRNSPNLRTEECATFHFIQSSSSNTSSATDFDSMECYVSIFGFSIKRVHALNHSSQNGGGRGANYTCRKVIISFFKASVLNLFPI